MNQVKETFDEYAVVDLGSNSFHMTIVRYVNNSLQIIYKNKQNIHLASSLDEHNNIDQVGIDRAASCLELFSERLKNIPPSRIRAIGTHALRVAKNRYHFLKQVASVFPYPIEVISGQEEARLIYIGIARTEPSRQSEVKLVIDIGGGSTEIAVGQTSSPFIVESRPMGCISYTEQFFPNQEITQLAFEKAKYAAEQQVEKISNLIKNQNISISFGSSGTIKCIHHILQDIGVLDGIITPKRLNDLISYLLEFKKFEQINYPSLSNERKKIFLGGIAILSGIFNAFGLKELHYCQSALKEGVLYEMIGDFTHQDIRQKTALALSKQYHVDQHHAGQVVNTAYLFFKQWQKQTKLPIDESLESILYWAALLHEVGLNINFSSIHKHSAYILQNSNMPGFNEEQQLLLSTLVKYHRKSIKLDKFPYFSLFEYKQVQALLQILRLAVLVNNQRSSSFNPNMFTLQITDKEITKVNLQVDKSFAQQNRLILLDLEQEQHYWKMIKNWQLEIELVDK